jgi:ATPase family associated with various cellular activities (AAA)
MNTTPTDAWYAANQRYLIAALAVVRLALERYGARSQDAPEPEETDGSGRRLQEALEAMPAPPALESLAEVFGLTLFERDLLLLCAGVELDSYFAACCAAAQDDPRRSYPTFGLALAVLPAAHWSAITPAAPRRHWRLVEVGTGDALTTSPLRIDERALHYVAGIDHLDERLQGLVEPLGAPRSLPPSQSAVVGRIARLWSRTDGARSETAVQLCGDEDAAKRVIASAASAAAGLRAYAVRATDIPAAASQREDTARLWEREAALSGNALLLDCQDAESADGCPRPALAFLERLRCPLMVAGREPLRLRKRPLLHLDVYKPTTAEQRSLWRDALGPLARDLNGQIEDLTSQFDLGAQEIRAASTEVLQSLSQQPGGAPGPLLWEACRVHSRPRLEDLAQRIEPAAGWDDLVLPDLQRRTLREIAAHVRQRARVYGAWGFASKGSRGLGISALFVGSSGTGKTMAGEVLANELRLDLYRIDLSQVVSKYIGETEKNLRRVFDAAEEGGAILLFDEADALFGRRSEVRDSHDRYANIEVSYLLQRMESYQGLAILTTNMKHALDTAFMRRLRFVVNFPFPDAGQRARIWQRVFPPDTPTAELDVRRLAQLNVAGGNIRNIALNAAFLAADAGESVGHPHLLLAARGEYAKLEKPLTEAETGGWA